jgi:cysteine-rich repeat protein
LAGTFLCFIALYSCADDGSPAAATNPETDARSGGDVLLPLDTPSQPTDASDAETTSHTVSDGDGGDVRPGSIDSSDEMDALIDAPRTSKYCGDRIRDPLLEECDDGPGALDDSCNADCRVRVIPLTAEGIGDAGPNDARGPAVLQPIAPGVHPAAASELGFAVAYGEFAPPSPVGVLLLQRFNDVGQRVGSPIDVGVGQKPTTWAKPVVAALPDSRYALAWTDDEAGIPAVRLRTVDAIRGTVGQVRLATVPPAQDPDLLWTGSELVVAWTDLVDAKYRTFDADLVALRGEQKLASMASLESGVALAPFGHGWAAAFYGNEEGFSALEVVSADLSWSTPPALPPPSDERPALVALDETHLLAIFAVGTDPANSGSSHASALRAAVLNTSSPGPVGTSAFGLTFESSDAAAISSSAKPSATRVGDTVYVAWESSTNVGNPNVSAGLVATVELDPLDPTNIVWKLAVPQSGVARLGPRLAAAPLFPGGALISLWEVPRNDGSQHSNQLVLDFRPSPFVFLPAD